MKTLLLVFLVVVTGSTAWPRQDNFVDDNDTKVIHFEPAGYPTLARVKHEEGIVVVRVTLDDNGQVVKASGISGAKDLMSVSIGNAQRWKFQPNELKAAVIIYEFQYAGGACGSDQTWFEYIRPNIAKITACDGPPRY